MAGPALHPEAGNLFLLVGRLEVDIPTLRSLPEQVEERVLVEAPDRLHAAFAQGGEIVVGAAPPITGVTKEIGLKGDFWGNRGSLSLGVFNIDRQNVALSWNNVIDFNAAETEDLMNPNDVLPGDPRYKYAEEGTASASRYYKSTENSRGADLTLQALEAGFNVVMHDHQQCSPEESVVINQDLVRAAHAAALGEGPGVRQGLRHGRVCQPGGLEDGKVVLERECLDR